MINKIMVFKTLRLCRNLKSRFHPLSRALFVRGIIIKPINARIEAPKAIQRSMLENHR